MTRSGRHPVPVRRGPPGRPAAFTLIELLVAAAIGLVVMASLVSLFAMFGTGANNGREALQLSARMRSVAWRLRQDLQGVTTEVRPFIRPESACGYLELVEGPLVDTGSSAPADCDDILMLTTASPGRPFTGLLSGSLSLESPVAEVAWFCKQGPPTADGLATFNLYRRQLLVSAAPGAGDLLTSNTTAFTPWDTFYLNNDLSVRREGNTLIANSLADLTRRQSRFLHNTGGTANPGVAATGPLITTGSVPATTTGTTEVLTSVREGEDLVLANVLAFDVRVFDPSQPSGGAYVNLTSPAFTFSTGPSGARIYDTWSMHTEFNGIQDSGASTDRATNLADDDGNGVVDDVAELEQPPPYNVPLRGVEIRIRCWEPTSRQVRQITVQHSFLAR